MAAVALTGSAPSGAQLKNTGYVPPKWGAFRADIARTEDARELRLFQKQYNRFRSALITAKVDPRITVAVLSAFAADGPQALVGGMSLADFNLGMPHPSAAAHICEADRLEAALYHLMGPPRHTYTDLVLDDDSSPPPRPTVRTGAAAIDRMYGIIKALRDGPKTCRPALATNISARARWTTPVRIASTGNDAADARVRIILRDLKREVPNLPVDPGSFPVDAADANFWVVAPNRFELDASLMGCFEIPCNTIHDMHQRSSRIEKIEPNLLQTSYVAQPYLSDSRIKAIVQVNTAGSISSASCGIPLGFEYNLFPPENQILWNSGDAGLYMCLAQAFGAVPMAVQLMAKSSPSASQIRIEALAQLNNLYR